MHPYQLAAADGPHDRQHIAGDSGVQARTNVGESGAASARSTVTQVCALLRVYSIPTTIAPLQNTPQVYVSARTKLTSTVRVTSPLSFAVHRLVVPQVTYSDLPGGYRTVIRELEPVVLPQSAQPGGSTTSPSLVFSPKGWVEVVDDPDSVAVIIVSQGGLSIKQS